MSEHQPRKIGIIGGGFTGTALLAALCKLTNQPLSISIYDKSGCFGAGPAYSTPYTHHLLNVRASDMSAYEDEPAHFVTWLEVQPDKLAQLNSTQPLAEQFVPRRFYYDYLQEVLKTIHGAKHHQHIELQFVAMEVVDVIEQRDCADIVTKDGQRNSVDLVVLALGNYPPASFPFPIEPSMRRIDNPWDYTALASIPADASVLIVGTGLSMIDAVLTLDRQGHVGAIYALSRHGLLPLPHSDVLHVESIEPRELVQSTSGMRSLAKTLRARALQHIQEGGDWRSVVSGLRPHISQIWQQASLKDKRQFLRHLLAYWNIHRHRVHTDIIGLLQTMIHKGQLHVFAGRVKEVNNGHVTFIERHTHLKRTLPVSGVINCMGPEQYMRPQHQPLIASLLARQVAVLDELHIGLQVSADLALENAENVASKRIYALGSPTRGRFWEMTSVPDLRKQVFELARRVINLRINEIIG